MTRSDSELDAIWRYCLRNRPLLEQSERAGCFHCGALFAPSDIVAWVNEPSNEAGPAEEAVTAICPRCDFDSVLPSAVVEIDPQLLGEMHSRYWGPPGQPTA